jgi:hypothetical protein
MYPHKTGSKKRIARNSGQQEAFFWLYGIEPNSTDYGL